jgi:nucleotide-binding universal stress UspA family protein
MIIVATSSRYIAAVISEKAFNFTRSEMLVMFGLTNSQAAATLAVLMIGSQLGLIYSPVLNGAILMVLVTCTIASLATEKGATKLADEDVKTALFDEISEAQERILIPISHPDTYEELINLGLIIKNKKISDNIYALNIIDSNTKDPDVENRSKSLLQMASRIVAATDQKMHEILRYDTDVSNGIFNTIKEKKITDIVIGVYRATGVTENMLSKLTEGILAGSVANTYIYHSNQPFNTLTKMVVVIPLKADEEVGFQAFINKIWNIANNSGMKFVVYASEYINLMLLKLKKQSAIELETINFTDWEDFLIVSSKLDANTGLMVFMSRHGTASRNEYMGKISGYFNKYFTQNNFIMYFPVQESGDH